MSSKDKASSIDEKFEMAMDDTDFLRERLKHGFGVPSTNCPDTDKCLLVTFYMGYCMAKGRIRK